MSQQENDEMIELLTGIERALRRAPFQHDMDAVFALADRITVLH
jgi:ABC-type uncharacterized transport system ATPase subunit